jgi:hypothetical protein
VLPDWTDIRFPIDSRASIARMIATHIATTAFEYRIGTETVTRKKLQTDTLVVGTNDVSRTSNVVPINQKQICMVRYGTTLL